jgi:transcription elongation factor GreA
MIDRDFTTAAGLRRTRSRLEQAIAAYKAVVDTNPEAAEAGDNCVWHDNFAFEENQRQMHQWARRVHDLRVLVQRLEVISPDPSPSAVVVGSRVEVLDERTGRETGYVIAGYDDGELREGRLAYNAPLGAGLLGAKVGETREIQLAGAVRELTILSIAPAEDQ